MTKYCLVKARGSAHSDAVAGLEPKCAERVCFKYRTEGFGGFFFTLFIEDEVCSENCCSM